MQRFGKFPESPGVYMMKDEFDTIIYVGKAINLKKRIGQYFMKSISHSKKVITMVSHISAIDYTVTDTELEALILEANLIKKYKPKYNILLKDDKTYPYIKIDTKALFPTVTIAHRRTTDGKYFGPYTNGMALKKTLEVIKNIWPIRRCKHGLRNKRPCLNFYIGKCIGPCSNAISRDDYMKMINDIIKFLEGDFQSVIMQLRMQMDKHAKALEFEKALDIRDKIFALQRLDDKQKIEMKTSFDMDIIGLARQDDFAVIKIFCMRKGKIIDQSEHVLTGTTFHTRAEVLIEFIKQFYETAPSELVVNADITDRKILEAWLKTKIINPKQGDKFRLLQLASHNANISLKRLCNSLSQLQKLIGLKTLKTVEAYDISMTQGSFVVGAIVSISEGAYSENAERIRRYKLKSKDDYACIHELVKRRFKSKNFPDLLLIDGGKGQVNAAMLALSELGITNVAVCGMIKDDKHNSKSLFFNGNEIEMPHDVFLLISRLQTRVHNIAINYHRKLRDNVNTMLEKVETIGPARSKMLMDYFGSIENILSASIDELSCVIPKHSAVLLHRFLQNIQTM